MGNRPNVTITLMLNSQTSAKYYRLHSQIMFECTRKDRHWAAGAFHPALYNILRNNGGGHGLRAPLYVLYNCCKCIRRYYEKDNTQVASTNVGPWRSNAATTRDEGPPMVGIPARSPQRKIIRPTTPWYTGVVGHFQCMIKPVLFLHHITQNMHQQASYTQHVS